MIPPGTLGLATLSGSTREQPVQVLQAPSSVYPMANRASTAKDTTRSPSKFTKTQQLCGDSESEFQQTDDELVSLSASTTIVSRVDTQNSEYDKHSLSRLATEPKSILLPIEVADASCDNPYRTVVTPSQGFSDHVEIPPAPPQPGPFTDWELSDETYEYPVPKPDDPWRVCHGLVQKYDNDMCEAWRDEVDKLLIFAGLFSAAVTAFTIESYKLLLPPSNAYSNTLYRTLGTSTTHPTNVTLLSTPVDPSPIPAAIRINILWFLSLTLGISTVLVGILCLQWLREYRREANLPHKQAFALRQMRHEGLLRWNMSNILSGLPLLLQSAVVLFFAGLLEFLWILSPVVAIPVTIMVSITMVFLVLTTILPTLQYLYQISSSISVPHFHLPQCPYKSPQSWMFHKLVTTLALGLTRFIAFLRGALIRNGFKNSSARYNILYRTFCATDWIHYDIYWQQFRNSSWISPDGEPRYISDRHDTPNGLGWVGAVFSENLDAIHAVHHCLRSLPSRDSHPAVQLFFRGQQLPDQLKSKHIDYWSEKWAKDLQTAFILDYFASRNDHAREELFNHRVELITRIINDARDGQQANVISSIVFQHSASEKTCLRLPFRDFSEVEYIHGDTKLQLLISLRSYATRVNDAGDNIWAIIEWLVYYMVVSEDHYSTRNITLCRELELLNTVFEAWVRGSPPNLKHLRVTRCLHYVLRFRFIDQGIFPLQHYRVEFAATFNSLLQYLDEVIDDFGFPEVGVDWTVDKWRTFVSKFESW